MNKKLIMLIYVSMSSLISGEVKNLLDLDLETFITALDSTVEESAYLGFSSKTIPVFDAPSFFSTPHKEKALLSFLYYKLHYEELCSQRNQQALENTKKLFPQYNKHISVIGDTVLMTSESRKNFEKSFNSMLMPNLKDIFGRKNLHDIYAIFLPIQLLGYLPLYNTDVKIVEKKVIPKSLKNIFQTIIDPSLTNHSFFRNILKNKDLADAFIANTIFGQLGFTTDDLKLYSSDPLENLTASLASLAKQISNKT